MQEIMTAASYEIVDSQQLNNDMLQSFVEFIDASENTVKTYARGVRQLYAYLYSKGISQPTRQDIIAFREELKASGHKPTTIQNYITATKLFFSWTAQEGYYPNIADHLKGAKLDREHKNRLPHKQTGKGNIREHRAGQLTGA